jgi:hypothetical protein
MPAAEMPAVEMPAAEMPAAEMPAADPGLLLGGPPTRITVTVA